MKKLIVAAAAVTAFAAVIAFANRDVELASLQNLQAMERASDVEGTRAALTWINENALEHLPVAATLRAEDAIAGVALRMGGDAVAVASR